MVDFFDKFVSGSMDFTGSLMKAGGAAALLWAALLLFFAGLSCFVFWLLSAALRRQEHARCFLHVLETGALQGRSYENSIVTLANEREKSLGIFFHLLAAHVEQGLRFAQALDRTPYLLPERVNAMLKVADEAGLLPRVLPVARRVMNPGLSETLLQQNRIGIVLFLAPIAPYVLWIFTIYVLPKLRDVSLDMMNSIPPWLDTIMYCTTALALFVFVSWFLVSLFTVIRAGGPRWLTWLRASLAPTAHRLDLWLPWRRKRLHRDFSLMFSLLLDAEMPEAKALEMAARSTGNIIFMRRAQHALQLLRGGARLTDAVATLEHAGEFKWRFQNAAHSHSGFLNALSGWHESLEARAFQQEQAVSQLTTSSLIFVNGAMILLLGLGMFGMLIWIIQEAALW